MHKPLTIRRPQVPQPQRSVHRPRQEGVFNRGQAQRHHFLSVPWEVPNVLVIVQRQVSDGVVDFSRTVDRSVLSVGEVYQIHSVLLAVHGPDLGAFFAVVNHYLVVLAAGYERLAARGEIYAVDFVGVLAEHLRDPEAPDHLVYQFHLHLAGYFRYFAYGKKFGENAAGNVSSPQPKQRRWRVTRWRESVPARETF